MNKYMVINGFASQEKESETMATCEKIVTHFDKWDKEQLKSEIFSSCEESFNAGYDGHYEIKSIHTESGNPEILFFHQNDFEYEWREAA